MAGPLIPLAMTGIREAAKKLADKKPLPNSAAERAVREKEAMSLVGALGAMAPAGYAIKEGAKKLSERNQQEREAKDEMKRETRGMKKGGTVSSASKRADGIAIKGKTKGRFV